MNPTLIKIFGWMKDNWIIFVVLVVVAFFLYQHERSKALLNSMARENTEEFARHTADLEAMRTTYEAERAQQEEINQRYTTEIERLTTDYNQRLVDLETRITARRRTFIRDTGGRPTEMADRLRERLGWGTE
jgi:Skp family chaperone for outer membrane proteins